MRFYDIQIGGPTPARYTSAYLGVNDPGALNIEMDIPVAPFHLPQGGSFVRIWGVSLETISQAKDFNGAPIKVYGGMGKGFPLANPAQAGLIVQGTVWQAFGNWVGTNQSLDLMIVTDGGGQPDEIKNIVWNWEKGTPMADAIADTMRTAAPDLEQFIDISDKLILTEDDVGCFTSFAFFAQHVKATSKKIIGGDYPGVDIFPSGQIVTIFDGTAQREARQIAFNDLIGQPTWIEPLTIQVSVVMRADIAVGDAVKMPATPVINSQTSSPRYRDESVFQGEFTVTLVRSVGNFRQPNAESWITVIEAVPKATQPAAA